MVQRLLKIPDKNSILLLGPRGTGKSTLVRDALAHVPASQILWVDLLQPEQEEELQRSPGSLRERIAGAGVMTVVIDEVQKIPALLDVAHELIESRGIRFILTGSSARKLKRGGANLLAGRAFALQLEAFSCVELGKRFNLQDALEFGLLPKIYFPDPRDPASSWTREEKTSFLQTYARTYLREEIQLEQHVRKIQPFRNFLEIAAQMNGKIVEYSNLSRDTGVDHKTIAEYFQILEETLIGFFLEPYSRSIRKRQGKKPKFFFFDPGVKRALERTLTVPLLPHTSAYGVAFEHFILLEIRKRAQVVNQDIRFSFFRTHDGSSEVDLILEKPGEEPCLVEIKSSKRVDESYISKFAKIGEAFGRAKLYIFCQENGVREVLGVRVMHWAKGLEEILQLSEHGNAPGQGLRMPDEGIERKIHPWRQCPIGQHRVVTHTLRTPPSKRNPAGGKATRHVHCANNPSGKDILYPVEIAEIASKYFAGISKMPCPSELVFKSWGAKFDSQIAGWVQYWNEVLKPVTPLEPNLIKALIASESRFRPSLLAKRADPNSARGLMQLTNASRKELGNEKGRLGDHFVSATREELNDPNTNICAGVRWIFYMHELESSRLNRPANWEEAVWRYKGLASKRVKEIDRTRVQKIFNRYYGDLVKCGK